MGPWVRTALLIALCAAAAALPGIIYLRGQEQGGQESGVSEPQPVLDALKQRQTRKDWVRTDLTVGRSDLVFLSFGRLEWKWRGPAKATGLALNADRLLAMAPEELDGAMSSFWGRLRGDLLEIRAEDADVFSSLFGGRLAASGVVLWRVPGLTVIECGVRPRAGKSPASLRIEIPEGAPAVASVDVLGEFRSPALSAALDLPVYFRQARVVQGAGVRFAGVRLGGPAGGTAATASGLEIVPDRRDYALLFVRGRTAQAMRSSTVSAWKVEARLSEGLGLSGVGLAGEDSEGAVAKLDRLSVRAGRAVINGIVVTGPGFKAAAVRADAQLAEKSLQASHVSLELPPLFKGELRQVACEEGEFRRPFCKLTGLALRPSGGPSSLLALAAFASSAKPRVTSMLSGGVEGKGLPGLGSVLALVPMESLQHSVGVMDLGFSELSVSLPGLGKAAGGMEAFVGRNELGNTVLSLLKKDGGSTTAFGLAEFLPEGELKNAEFAFSGPRFSSALRARVPGGMVGQGDFTLGLNLEGRARKLLLHGTLAGRNVMLESKRVADWPVAIEPFRLEFGGEWDPAAERLQIDVPTFTMGEVHWSLSLSLARFTSVPAVDISVVFPKQDCGKMLKAFPKDLLPRLQEAKLKGPIEYSVRFAIDMRDIRSSLRFDVKGDWSKCMAEDLGPEIDVEALNSPDYVHRVVVDGKDLEIDVGPGTDSFVPLHRIPLHVQAAAWGTEDLGFFKHQGFKVSLMRRALVLFFERGRFVYGGSTVSQQLVKNLFMYREKTISRKLEEAVITWQMERTVSKDRILELYLNCIEFGPKIWGIKAAASVYFDKNVEALTPLEAAFIMGLKPDPVYGYLQYRRGRVGEGWKQNLSRVMDRLYKQMKVITRAEYEAESDLQPHFAVRQRDKAVEKTGP